MLILNYPVRLQNDVEIVNRTEYGGYLIKYKTKEGNNGIIWLPDGLEIHCPVDSKGGEAIELVRKYIHSLLVYT
jgi:hypothetical protein